MGRHILLEQYANAATRVIRTHIWTQLAVFARRELTRNCNGSRYRFMPRQQTCLHHLAAVFARRRSHPAESRMCSHFTDQYHDRTSRTWEGSGRAAEMMRLEISLVLAQYIGPIAVSALHPELPDEVAHMRVGRKPVVMERSAACRALLPLKLHHTCAAKQMTAFLEIGGVEHSLGAYCAGVLIRHRVDEYHIRVGRKLERLQPWCHTRYRGMGAVRLDIFTQSWYPDSSKLGYSSVRNLLLRETYLNRISFSDSERTPRICARLKMIDVVTHSNPTPVVF
jgi:hypothetical protein